MAAQALEYALATGTEAQKGAHKLRVMIEAIYKGTDAPGTSYV